MTFDPTAATQEVASALISACRQGNTAQVQSITSQYPFAVSLPDNNGWTSLHHACASGATLDLVHALVLADPQVLAMKSIPEGCTVLHCAAGCPETRAEIVDFLIQQRSSLAQELDSHGRSALHWICRGTSSSPVKTHATLDIVRNIYQAWNDAIYLPDQEGQLPIHLAYLSGAPGSFLKYLASLDPASVSTPLPGGRLLAHCVASDLMQGKKSAKPEVLESLIQADSATLYVQDPSTGKTLVETSKDPAFAMLESAKRFRDIIDNRGEGKLSPSKGKGTKSDSLSKGGKTAEGKLREGGEGTTIRRFSREQVADMIVRACAQPTPPQEEIRLLVTTYPEAVRVRDQENFLPLHWACYHGAQLQMLRLLVDAWPESLRETISQGRLPLHLACRQSASLERIQFLVGKYPESVDRATSQGMLPIHYACRDAAPLDVIQFMLDQSPMTAHQATASGLLPIHLACKHGKSPETIQFLLERWPGCLREPGTDKLLPIHFLCRAGSSVPIEWMIQQDPYLLEMADANGNLPLHYICKNPKSTVEAVKLVLEGYPEAASQPNSEGMTPADLATEVNTEVANFLEAALLSKRRKTGGNRPLHQACSDPRVTVQMVKDILTESPDEVCVPDEERLLPIHIACRSGASLEVIQCLAEDWPESLRWTNKGGSLPLHTACSNKASARVVHYLITSWPKSTSVANNYGWLPLHCACAYGASSEVVSLLVDRNSSSMATYGQGDYPLHLACCGSPSLEVIYWLIEAREEGVKLANTAGELALHKACFNNAPIEVVQLLVEQFPDSLFVADQHGATPQHVAEMRKHHSVAEWLKSKEA